MSFPKYPRYKDSGIEWLGEVPEHWDIWKVAHAFSHIGSGTTPPSEESEWYGGDICWVTTGELRETRIYETAKKVTREAVRKFGALKLHPPESVLIALYGATIGRLGILGIEATANQACCALAKSQVLSEKFTFYWLLAFRNEIISLSSGGGQPNISQEKIASLKIPAPEHSEQDGIVTFLDRETAKIDTLIAKQERLIELLQEKRQALILHAVTKGLNPDAPMKDSGIEWLGEIPAHWETKRIKRGTGQITNGFVGPTRDILRDEGVRYIQSLHVKNQTIKFETPYFVEKNWSDAHSRSILSKNDVVIVQTGGCTGEVAIVPDEFEGSNCHALIILKSVESRGHNPYLLNVMISEYGRQCLESVQTGALHPHLNSTIICDIVTPSPPLTEQAAIAAYLNEESAKLDRLMAKVETAIVLLKEHRIALISAAVTGKIDVREADSRAEAAALP